MKYSHHQIKYIGKYVGLRTYQHPGTMNNGSSPGVKRAGREVIHPPQSATEVKD